MGEELKCYVCNQESSSGIILLNHYICRNCEEEMMELPHNQLKYLNFKRKIKEIWQRTAIQV